MRESASNPKNKASKHIGRTLHIFLMLVSNRMMPSAATTPVGAIKSPLRREGSGLKSDHLQTKSGAKKAQHVMAIDNSVFPRKTALNDVFAPDCCTKMCTNSIETSI